MIVDQMIVDQMIVDQMIVDQTKVDQMKVDHMNRRHFFVPFRGMGKNKLGPLAKTGNVKRHGQLF